MTIYTISKELDDNVNHLRSRTGIHFEVELVLKRGYRLVMRDTKTDKLTPFGYNYSSQKTLLQVVTDMLQLLNVLNIDVRKK